MASEYLKQKYKDVKPDEPLVLTKKQKLQNWWDYHKFWVLIVVIVAVVAGYFVYDMVTKVEPDYGVAVVSEYAIPEEISNLLADTIEPYGEDLDGDGQVAVAIYGYTVTKDNPMAYLDETRLLADLSTGTCQIFLLQDPIGFQEHYNVLMERDGTAMEEGEDPHNCLLYAVEQVPALAELNLNETFYLARSFVAPGEEDPAAGLWQALTEGAVPYEGAGE